MRPKPQNTDVEKLLIGELIQFTGSLDDITPILSPEDFYSPKHEIIYRTIFDLWSEGKKVDLPIVQNRLNKNKKLDDAGGISYLLQTLSEVTTDTSIVEHAYIVKEASVKRQFIDYAAEVGNKAFDATTDIDELLNTGNSGLDKITDGIFKVIGTETFQDIIKGTIDDYYVRKEKAKKGDITGIRTPLHELNQMTGGWQNGDLVIIAGRPSMGKTAFAVQCGVTASRLDYAVDIYTLEMTSKQLTQRIMANTGGIDIERFRVGKLREEEEQGLENIIGKLEKLNINLDDKPGISAEYIKAKSSANKRRGKCDLIIVDYLQLMSFDTKLNTNEGLGSITRKLKGLAKELDVPVILLSQLSRALEQRGSKRPLLSDLRSSGEIEQDADMVIFPFREFYYTGLEEHEGKVDVIIAKHRNGRIGTIEAYHNETITNFYDEQEQPF